ncbi:MAG: hypothetical protein ACLUHK_07210 [Eubacteriales bacterium]
MQVFALTFDECGFVSVQTLKRKMEEPEPAESLSVALFPISTNKAALPVSLFLERAFSISANFGFMTSATRSPPPRNKRIA